MTETHIGKQVFMATAVPATNDDTGFEALTWVKVSGFVGGFQLGFSTSNVDIPDLESGITLGAKGMRSGQDSTGTFRRVDSDTGQGSIKTEADSEASAGSIKIVSAAIGAAPASGDRVQYAQGYFHSYIENEVSGDGYEGFSVNFKQNQPTVDATEPV
jgi:hypothetical protein